MDGLILGRQFLDWEVQQYALHGVAHMSLPNLDFLGEGIDTSRLTRLDEPQPSWFRIRQRDQNAFEIIVYSKKPCRHSRARPIDPRKTLVGIIARRGQFYPVYKEPDD